MFPVAFAFIQLRDSLQYLQTNISTTFQYQPSQADLDKYIFFELRISNIQEGLSQLFMACSLNEIPSYQLDGDNQYIEAMYADLNANYENLTYHNILISPMENKYEINDNYFITIFIPNKTTYLYSLKVSSNQNAPCPNNCSNQQNACKSGFCDCQSNTLDLDCSKQAIELNLNQAETLIVNGFSYLYYQISKNQSNKLTFQISQSQRTQNTVDNIVAYLLIEDFVHGVPNSRYSSQTKQLTTNTDIKFVIYLKEVEFINQIQRYQKIIISIYSPQVQIIQVLVQNLNENNNDNRFIILISCAVVALVIIIIGIITYFVVKCKYQQNARVQEEQSVNQQLNLNIINEYMPIYQYARIFEITQFKRKQIIRQKNDQCTVCLIEFEELNDVRFCPCLHIFHSKCLELWFLKHQNCPNCRLEMSLKDLKKYEMEYNHRLDLDQQQVQINSQTQRPFNEQPFI
ncbi:hypothetical protein pb186bvf_004445 [Paramecium bursaria]